jgi:hypothetical protein
MRTIAALSVAVAVLSTGPVWAASCQDRGWPPGKGFTCVPLTNSLLVSLEGASRADVTKAMQDSGRPIEGEDGLHFNSVADRDSGDVNLRFYGDRVELVTASVDRDSGPDVEFIWNPHPDGMPPYACSDLPGSHYARCNK